MTATKTVPARLIDWQMERRGVDAIDLADAVDCHPLQGLSVDDWATGGYGQGAAYLTFILQLLATPSDQLPQLALTNEQRWARGASVAIDIVAGKRLALTERRLHPDRSSGDRRRLTGWYRARHGAEAAVHAATGEAWNLSRSYLYGYIGAAVLVSDLIPRDDYLALTAPWTEQGRSLPSPR